MRKVDIDAKKITLKHGEIKNLDMPPMTMVFQAKDPAVLAKFKVGVPMHSCASSRATAAAAVAVVAVAVAVAVAALEAAAAAVLVAAAAVAVAVAVSVVAAGVAAAVAEVVGQAGCAAPGLGQRGFPWRCHRRTAQAR